MSTGQRIDDHSFWAGAKPKDSVFPDGPHKRKSESSAKSDGDVMHYEDTTEAIKSAQNLNAGQARKHHMKPGHRN
jgi:FtsZ-interacting cell division protein ZipA